MTCADVQRDYFGADRDHALCGYISVPSGKAVEAVHRRELWLKHFIVHVGPSDSSRLFIARHHFPPRAFAGRKFFPRLSTAAGPAPYPVFEKSDRVSCLYAGATDYFTVPNVPYSIYSVVASNDLGSSCSTPNTSPFAKIGFTLRLGLEEVIYDKQQKV